MSSKLVLVCFAGAGGSAAVYGIYAHNTYQASNKVEQGIDTETDNQKVMTVNTTEVTKNTAKCTSPTHKITITKDTNVEYHMCASVIPPTNTATTTTATIAITTDNTFTQIQSFASVLPSTKWTYKNTTPNYTIDIYWLRETVGKDIFFISKPTTTTPIDLEQTTNIKSLVKNIEKLRKTQIIATTTTAASTPQAIDSISCTAPKQLTNNKTKEVQYYSCTEITGGTNENGTEPTDVSGQTSFTPDTTFKTKTGVNHTITKWKQKNESAHYFYWFKPNTPSNGETKKTIFFIRTSDAATENTKSIEMVREIEKFLNATK